MLFATAQPTSWAVFRSRWRSIAFLAVALVAVTVTAVAATAAVLVPRSGAHRRDRDRLDALRRGRGVMQQVQSATLAAAWAEVLAARREPGIDPEAADRGLHRLDLRTVLLG